MKELNVRIVDLETKSYASSPRPMRESRRLESRIEELTSKLTQESKEKSETLRMSRSADKSVRDTKFQLMESDRQRVRLEDEVKAYEKKVGDLRQSIDTLVSLNTHVLVLIYKVGPGSKHRKVIFNSRSVGQSVRLLSIKHAHSGMFGFESWSCFLVADAMYDFSGWSANWSAYAVGWNDRQVLFLQPVLHGSMIDDDH